jgi:hypothetical protein
MGLGSGRPPQRFRPFGLLDGNHRRTCRIVSIETEAEEVDVYTSVATQIGIPVAVEVKARSEKLGYERI